MTATSITTHSDFLVIGAGMAGASAAFHLAPFGKTMVLEQEEFPGYHTTGRSAAMVIPSYGPPQVRALTAASMGAFHALPELFGTHALLTPRGTLMVAEPGQLDLLQEHALQVESTQARAHALTGPQACELVPVLRPDKVGAGLLEPDCFDVDVNTLFQGFLRGIKQGGGGVVQKARVVALQRSGGLWQVRLESGQTYAAPVVLNAAGAWAEAVGALAGAKLIGLEPRRRTAFTFRATAGTQTAAWPLVGGVDETWYMKPEAGLLLGSPANADPSPPCDVQPEELDVALGIHRIEEMTTLTIRRPERIWAGLRSFVPDGGLVAGFDAQLPGFFWVAGQGGYGIQTAPAMGVACAALARSKPLPQHLVDHGLTEAMLSPSRLRSAPG